MSSYLLKFKVSTAADEAFIERPSFEAAVEEVFESANELEWALRLDGIPTKVNSEDVTQAIIGEVNFRMLNPDWAEREADAARRDLTGNRSAYRSQVM